MVQIRDGLRTNQVLGKEPFRLNALSRIALSRNRPIDAIAAFATMERHAELADWRSARSVRPAGRFLSGTSLPLRYLDSDQSHEIQDLVRRAREQERAQKATGKRKADMTKDERKAVAWSLEGVTLRMRIDRAELPIPLAQFLAQNPIADGQRAVLSPLWSQNRTDDSSARRYPTPAWRLLRGMAIDISSSGGEMLDITFRDRPWLQPGYGFGALPFVPEHDVSYVVDERPDSETGSRQFAVIQAIKDDRPHAGYAWIAENQSPATRKWSQIAIDAQSRFMAGLDAFGDAVPGAMTWEPEKRRFIGDGGERRMTLVQGPPGTGKSTTSGMALWARMQGAMAAGIPLRIGLACKTHKATDVLLAAVDNARVRLRDYQRTDEALFAQYFDERIFQVPLHRFADREASAFKAPDGKSASDRIEAMEQFPYVVCAATSHGLGRFVGNQW
ncbi:MAG TPA: hypothetical protein PK691_11060, partial [Thermomicrobiales bacterium]|nr:hypothetical protein [Thermomicrobiales bacterium]